MAITLAKSGVVFNPDDHTYTLDGKPLQGITSTLLRHLFPGQYAGIPEETLRKAAERGSLIHEQIEVADSLGVESNVPEVKSYLTERENIGLETIENEYIVSDFEHFASPIDLVMADDAGNVSLGDIKTTYAFNEQYVAWQLSIYAYLFERQNLGLEVKHLFGVWIKNKKCKFIEVQRHSDKEVEDLINAYLNGLPYAPQETQVALIEPDAVQLLISATAAYEEAKQAMEEVKAALQKAMEAHKVKSWETDTIKATYVAPAETTTFDTKRFQSEHPELYNEYTKTSTKKASVRITIR